MRKKHQISIWIMILLFLTSNLPVALAATDYLQKGSKGARVKELQLLLKEKGVYRGKINNIFDSNTHKAVVKWQKMMGLPAKGIVGPATWASLKANTKKPMETVSRSGVDRVPDKGELIDWSIINQMWVIGRVATIIDVETGKQIQVKRIYGHNHADVVPLTFADTSVLKSLYGKWSWDRRAVIVFYNGQYWAGSINGMPHGEGFSEINNFPGHFCVHFLNSKTHGSSYTKSGKPLIDSEHQKMVRKAAGL